MSAAPRVKVAGVRLDVLRSAVVDSDLLVSPRMAAALVRRAGGAGVSRQLVALWAQRYGERGVAFDREVRGWGARERILVSLRWLISFLERSGRGV